MSDELAKEFEKTKLEKKFLRRLGEEAYGELVTSHANMTKEQLEKHLLELAKTQQGIINTRNSDKALNDLKEQVREQNRPYTDQLRANKELTRYASLIISERFGDELMDKTAAEETEQE